MCLSHRKCLKVPLIMHVNAECESIELAAKLDSTSRACLQRAPAMAGAIN